MRPARRTYSSREPRFQGQSTTVIMNFALLSWFFQFSHDLYLNFVTSCIIVVLASRFYFPTSASLALEVCLTSTVIPVSFMLFPCLAVIVKFLFGIRHSTRYLIER